MSAIKMFKYSFCYTIKSYGVFAAIMLAIVHLGMLTVAFGGYGGFGGLELSTYAYTVALGIAMFKENFNMSVQSCVSRKTFFIGSSINNLVLALIAVTFDTLVSLLGNLYEKNIKGFIYDNIYEQTYMISENSSGMVFAQPEHIFRFFIMNITIDLACLFIGFFIGSLFYRLTKIFKIMIPVAIFVAYQGVGIVDYMLLDSAITRNISKFIIWITESSWNFSAIFIIAALIFASINFLMTRKLTIKERI